MGKEWLHWVAIGGSRSSSSSSSSRRSSARKGRNWGEMENEVASTGCICAVFQMFDLHPVNHHQRSDFSLDSQKGADSAKGIEAPRNSLELCNYSTAIQEETHLDFPNVGIGIRTNVSSLPRVTTSHSKSGSNDFSSSCDSPGTKTPTLVARLMGLDLLPDCNSPSNSNLKSNFHTSRHTKDRGFLQGRSSRSFYDNDISSGTRSLPETPRVSSARRSDVEGHRLSLQFQMNKENLNEEFDSGTRSCRFHSAKHFDKQVHNRRGRRVGLDVTNTNRAMEKTRRDENLVPLKPRLKKSKKFPGEIGPGSRESFAHSCSLDKPTKNSDSHPLRQRNQTITPSERKQKSSKEVKSPGKCSSSEFKKSPRQSCRTAIRNKKQEQFVHSTGKKSKKTALSSDILTKLTPASIQALISKSSIQLSRNPSYPYYPKSYGRAAAEYGNYVQTILERSGIVQNAPPFPLLRQIDHSIFDNLESFFHSGGGTKLSHRCNRKLIFELVGEFLCEILRPRFDLRARVFVPAQFPLVEELGKKIEGLSATNCATIEEIDCLIDEDLRKSVFDEELESTVCEIEGEIVERLVGETAAIVVIRRGGGTDGGST